MSTVDSSDTGDFSDIVGVFRERTQAEEAMEGLRQTGFAEDTIKLIEYRLRNAADTMASTVLEPSNKRIIVHVKAPGKEQEAVGILNQYGANNADIPVGTRLDHGILVGAGVETDDLVPQQATEATTEDDLFQEGTVPGIPAEPGKEDVHTPRL